MKKTNPCCSGDTLVLTTNGPVRFDELAKANNDVEVYCFDTDGRVILSKMVHPRISGYKQQIVKITLENGVVLRVTQNHEILTDKGYVPAEEIYEDDNILVDRYNENVICVEIPGWLNPYIGTTPTKKGTIMKVSEVTGEEFEVTWEEREVACEDTHQSKLNDIMYECFEQIEKSTRLNKYVKVDSVEFLKEKETVYNGTVVKLHNYFTYDPSTHIIVNQKNCGE